MKREDYVTKGDLLESLIESGVYETNEIIDELVTFFVGGFDTTSKAVELALYSLGKNPDWKTKIQLETSEMNAYNYEQINKLENLEVFLKETLRYTPPVTGTIHRVSSEDVLLGGYQIKNGTKVRIDILS
jgi:cytochrome P450